MSASNHVKTKDNLRPPLMCGLNQWIGGARRLSCSATMRRGDRGEYRKAAGAVTATLSGRFLAACAVYAPLTKTAAPLTPHKNAPWGTYRELQPERGRNGMRRLKGNPTAEYKDRPSDRHKGRAWALADRTRRAARRLPIPLRRRTCCRYRQIECRVKPSDVAFS